jgi:hypothetical protein
LFDRFKSPAAVSGMKVPARFKFKVERKTATQDLMFDAEVRGSFIARGGKPDFTIEEMRVVGNPNMDMNGFLPKEIEEIRRYAMKVEYPRLLGLKRPGET